ncbi:MAG: hypothetical protein IJ971_01615 [Bacteroidales bacterium]|nr:hypothetical protein [Bacteroidales bacterium]
MAKRTDWAVNVDKLRVCFTMPENLYDYLRNQDTRRDELTDSRILDEETFSLVFTEEDEVKMTAVLNVRDVEGYYRLGTFTFSNSAKYAGKAFFSFENSALYRVYLRFPNAEPKNHICDLQYVADFYGMEFNNITELELAFDSTFNYISKVRKMIKDTDAYDLYLNGKKVKDDETLDGYGEYYTRSRVKMSKLPTLYFSQAKDTDMKMRVYDKARELNENSPNKAERLKEWLGWDTIDKLYRVEVVLHNTNVREFVERYGERLYSECGEHSNVLNLLGMSDFRLAMFLDSVDRLIYFRNKKTREKISLVELASGI